MINSMADSEIKKSNILVVDDEREHAQVMCEALSRQGHKCDATYNLAEARGRLGNKRYDVVVTDLMMDGRRDGLEVLRTARDLNPAPPVVLVTAHADIPTCKQSGLDVSYMMLRGIFMPGGVTPDQVAYYVGLLKKVQETPEWKDLMAKGAFDQTSLEGQAYADWVAKEEARHVALMKAAGFMAGK